VASDIEHQLATTSPEFLLTLGDADSSQSVAPFSGGSHADPPDDGT